MNLHSASIKRFALIGGGEFRHSCSELDLAILSVCNSDSPRIAVVPTAAANERPELAANNGIQHFTALGATAFPIYVLTRKDANDDSMAAQIDNSDVVYLTGGDPSHLVNVMTGSLFLETIRTHAARDLVLAGSSAGAMAMGSEMRYRNESNAFGIVSNTIIIPHHENRNPEETYGQVKELTKKGITIFGIGTSTGIVSDSVTLSVHGTGRVVAYNSEGWKEYLPGQIIPDYP